MDSKLQLIKSIENERVDIDLYVSDDYINAYFLFERVDSGAIIDLGVLHTILEDNGIVCGVKLKELKSLVKRLNGGEIQCDGEKYNVASAKPPKFGRDGYLDFHVTPSINNPRFDVDEEEMIDYKNTSLITNVTTEQHLVTLVPECPGEAGVDVYGMEIEVGEPKPLKYISGQGVYKDGDKIFASVNGMFIYEDDHLSVTSVYNVLGSVDFTVGNINFVGKVIVGKDVLDDFSISGNCGIEVGGVVGAANLESGSDMVLTGGINGQTKSYIKSQGGLKSKYLNEVNATAWGDVFISKSIINCVTRTKGKIVIRDGSIIGGIACALKGVEVATLGSDLGIATHVIAGQDYEFEERKQSYELQMNNIQVELGRIDRVVGPIVSNSNALNNLTPAKKKMVISMIQKAKKLKEDHVQIVNNLEEISAKDVNNAGAEILVRNILYSGVKVTVGKFVKIIKMEIKGPIVLKEDLENNTVMIVESVQ